MRISHPKRIFEAAAQPDFYLQNTEWAHRFGPVERQEVEDFGRVTSLRVWHEDGLEVEYGFTDEAWIALPIDAGTRKVIAGGMRVLYERGDILSRHRSTTQG